MVSSSMSCHTRLAFEGGSGADSGGHFYVCERTAELNEHFGDLLHKIQDLEVHIQSFGSCQCMAYIVIYRPGQHMDP